jgi:hypothetical protein
LNAVDKNNNVEAVVVDVDDSDNMEAVSELYTTDGVDGNNKGIVIDKVDLKELLE